MQINLFISKILVGLGLLLCVTQNDIHAATFQTQTKSPQTEFMKKQRYLDLMEKTLCAYDNEHIKRYFSEVKSQGLTEHGFPRLTANIGILIANGRRQDLRAQFLEMMDFCCSQIPKVKAANDFSVKEIVFAIMEVEKNKTFPAQKITQWKEQLKTIKIEECYNVFARTEADKLNNWAAFTMVSEWMRNYIGIAVGNEQFIDIQSGSQLKYLDENGMYRDPGEPMVYDLVTRGLFSLAHHFGCHDKYYNEWEDGLKKAGLLTLRMQSVNGEIPFGGRSMQFLHNEAHLAIICEYEANRYAKDGNLELAGQFKQAAKLALDNIEMYLNKRPIHHIKNRFPLESMYGCDGYGYFDKYMITTASFLYAAYVIADENIPLIKQEEPWIDTLQLSDCFHKLFLRHGEYFTEIEYRADLHYDANGLGRLHRKGAPAEICISSTGSNVPRYKIDLKDAVPLAIAPGCKINDKWIFAFDNESKYYIKKHGMIDHAATAQIDCNIAGKTIVKSTYRLDENGLDITLNGDGEIGCSLPAFEFDGEEKTKIVHSPGMLEIYYKNWVCRYIITDGVIEATEQKACNRNGHYRMFRAIGKNQFNVKIEIEKSRANK